jgi:hypothetical protein
VSLRIRHNRWHSEFTFKDPSTWRSVVTAWKYQKNTASRNCQILYKKNLFSAFILQTKKRYIYIYIYILSSHKVFKQFIECIHMEILQNKDEFLESTYFMAAVQSKTCVCDALHFFFYVSSEKQTLDKDIRFPCFLN